MDTTVLQELLQREACDLAADAVETGEDHRAGRVVDDEVDPGQALEHPYVSPLPADDPALQVVRVELHHGDRGLGRMAARDPLHDRREDAPGAPVGVAAGLLLHLADEPRAVVADLVLELAQENLPRLGARQAGDPLELADLVLLGGLQLLNLVVEVAPAILERCLAPLELREPDRELLLLAEDALLDARDLGPALAQLVVDRLADGSGACAVPVRGRLGRARSRAGGRRAVAARG